MLTNLKIKNAYSIKDLDMSFIKGKYEYKEEMIQTDIVNPVALYGNNGSGKSSVVNAVNDLLNLLISDKDSFYPLIANFKDKNNNSIIELTFSLDKDTYNYYVETNFKDSRIEKEYLLENKKAIFTRNQERIIIEDKEYLINDKLLLSVRQLYAVLNELNDTKNAIKKVYDYLVNITIVKGDNSLYNSSLCNYKSVDDLMVTNNNEIKQILSNFKGFPIYDFLSENETYYLNMYLDNNENIKIPGFLISDGMLTISKILGVLVNLKSDSLLIIDGIEKNLHPTTILNLIKEAKKRDIQILFTSHNTSLMQELRPDQIYFSRWKKGYSYYFRLTNIYENIKEINNIEKMYLSNTFDEKINEIISIE